MSTADPQLCVAATLSFLASLTGFVLALLDYWERHDCPTHAPRFDFLCAATSVFFGFGVAFALSAFQTSAAAAPSLVTMLIFFLWAGGIQFGLATARRWLQLPHPFDDVETLHDHRRHHGHTGMLECIALVLLAWWLRAG